MSYYGSKKRSEFQARNQARRAAEPASEAAPVYRKVLDTESGATPMFFIVCDEGWRESIVCERMYEWAADWLLTVLERKPYAPNEREKRLAPSTPQPDTGETS